MQKLHKFKQTATDVPFAVSSILELTAKDKYKVVQDQLFESDFDKEIKKMLNK